MPLADNSMGRYQRGSALLMTLWVTVLLSMVVLTSMMLVRSFAVQLRSQDAQHRRYLLASNVIADLQELDKTLSTTDTSNGFEFRQTQGTLLETINTGSIEELESVFTQMLPGEVVHTVVALIIDSRDADQLASAYGRSFRIDSERAALNRPFLSLGEVARTTELPLPGLRCLEEKIRTSPKSASSRVGRISTVEIRDPSSERASLIIQLREMGGNAGLSLVSVQSDRHSRLDCAIKSPRSANQAQNY